MIFTDVQAEAAAAAAAKWPTAIGRAMDVTREEQVQAVIDEIVRTCGRLDVVVNNAGVNTLAHRVTIDEFPRSEWDRLLSVDLTGLYLVSKASAKVMKEQKAGKIINIASIAGLVPLRLQCAFVAAKAGVVGLTRALALELARHGITVNCIPPGMIDTPMLRRAEGDGDIAKLDKLAARMIPVGRIGTPEEVAATCSFLCSDEAAFITGRVLGVNGGMVL